jgi:chromosome segregation ATPase
MAEIVSIKVKVEDHGKAMSQVIALKNNIDYINSHPINVKVDNANQLEQITRKMTAYNNSVARRVTAETRLATAIEYRKAEESKAQAAIARRGTAEERTKQAIERTRQAEERTAQATERTRQATERTRQAEERTAQTRERTVQITERQSAANNRLGGSMTGIVAQFVSLHMLLSRTVSAFRDALQTMKDVDSALVTIQKTTGFTGDQLDRLTNSAYELANAYGRTATEILNAASVYARAGFKDNLDQMTELSALLQNVGDLEGEVAAKFLIATNAAWKLNGSYGALMGVIDGLNAQTNQAAVDMEALTSGITVAGSVFSNAGESVQTFAGLLGAGVALTQRSGSEIARGLRTIAMNIRQIKGELDDGEIIDEASISDAAKALHSVGISVADANGELRLTSEVLDELAGRWSSLTTAEQSYLAQSLAGKRQANILTALMNNWSEAQRQMTLYANGAGSAMQENEIYLNSWEAKTKRLSATWTQFVNNLVDTDLIKTALDGIIKIVEFLDTDVGRLLVTAIGVGTAVTALAGAVGVLKSAVIALTGAMSANPLFLAAAGATAAIGGIVWLADALTTTTEEYAEKAEDAWAAYKEINSEVEQIKSRAGELTEYERKRLDILKAEAEIRHQEAVEASKEHFTAKYRDYSNVGAGSRYDAEYQKLQRELETAARGSEGPILKRMSEIEAVSGAQNRANQLVGRYAEISRALENSDLGYAQLKKLEDEATDLRQEIVDLAGELNDFGEEMGKDFPKDAQLTLDFLMRIIGVITNAKEETKDAASSTVGAIDEVQRRLQSFSDAADSIDVVIGGVVDALHDYGAGSVQVYNAMKNLESVIPGSTDKLYDFETATLLSSDALDADKASLLDLIDAEKQVDFQNAIDQMNAVSQAAWEMWAAEAMAMQGLSNDDLLRAGEWMGVNPDVASQISEIKKAKADWDEWITTLRSRSSYQPSKSSGSSSASQADPELETRKQAVALLKSELEFLKAKGASEEEIVAKQKQIQSALHDQAEYMREIGANQSDINALSTEWWKIQNEIAGDGEDILQQHKDRVALLKSELAILESKGASTDEINAKEREIQAAIKAQADYMESVGASQTEINALTKEWWDIENKILSTHEKILETVQKTIDEYYDKAITDKEKELQLEEKILAVQQAQAALANAQKERTVRYFNAASGQWEWGANPKNVKAAQDALKKAQDDLNKYQKEQAWKEFKDAWEYVSDQIKAGAITFQQAYNYMETKMKEIQNKYNVDMGGVLRESIGGFQGVNKTIKDLDADTAAQLGASVGQIKAQNEALAAATGSAKDAVKEFKDAYDTVVAAVKSGDMSFDDAYAYLKQQAEIISAKYGTDMTGALDKAIEEMETIYQDLDSIKEAVKKGKITPDNAFEIISRALDSVSQKYGQDITGKVNKILDEKGGFKDGIGGLAQAVKDGKISIDDAFGYLEDATSEVADQYGIDMTGELNTAIQKMGKSGEALDDLWKSIVLNKMRMNSVSWLELDEQKKKAQASGDTALAKAIGEQQDQLHAENEALGKTIGATYDKSGHWSLNGSTLYDPAADRASGAFSGGGGGGGGVGGSDAGLGLSNTMVESHYIPGFGYMNVGQAVADLFKAEAGAVGNPMMRQLILREGTDAEKAEYLSTGRIPASFANRWNSIRHDIVYSGAGGLDNFTGSFDANGNYTGNAVVYKGVAGGSLVPVVNGQVAATGLGDTGSNILLTPDGQVLRIGDNNSAFLSGETWSATSPYDMSVYALLRETMMAMEQSGQYTSEELYGRKHTGVYDSGGVLHGVGGIKATARDEMVLPPDITERLLTPANDAFVQGRMNFLRSIVGMPTQFAGGSMSKIGAQYNGDIANYTMNGVTISEGQARTTTVYDLAQIARSLGAYQRS